MSTNKPFDFFIQWHLTERCNLRCRHCYQRGGAADELTREEIAETISEAADMIDSWSEAYGIPFARSMNITGGEPFLRRDLADVIADAGRAGFETFLLTNGTLVDRERARMLADLGVSGVQVSIEGPEDIHDAIRGKGSFAASAAGIGHLVQAGLPVTLNATLSTLNAHLAKGIVAFGAQAGARNIGFSRLVPDGAGTSLKDRMLAPEKARDVYRALFSLDTGGPDIVTGDPVAAQLRTTIDGDAGDTPTGGCSAGVAGLTIHPDGTVTPCRRMPIPLGNVRRDSLRELWTSSPVLAALRDRKKYTGKCGACPRWARCRGCRAIAHAFSRSQGGDNYLADDPQCFIE